MIDETCSTISLLIVEILSLYCNIRYLFEENELNCCLGIDPSLLFSSFLVKVLTNHVCKVFNYKITINQWHSLWRSTDIILILLGYTFIVVNVPLKSYAGTLPLADHLEADRLMVEKSSAKRHHLFTLFLYFLHGTATKQCIVFLSTGVLCAVTTWPTGTMRRMASCTAANTTGRSLGRSVMGVLC